MEEFTEFSMKKSLALPCLANGYFNSLRNENDESLLITMNTCGIMCYKA